MSTPAADFSTAPTAGHDSIVIYNLDTEGLPTLAGHQSTLGEWPRAFMIDRRGEFLIVGNRHTDDAVVFAIDPADGSLSMRSQLSICAPIAFKMLA